MDVDGSHRHLRWFFAFPQCSGHEALWSQGTRSCTTNATEVSPCGGPEPLRWGGQRGGTHLCPPGFTCCRSRLNAVGKSCPSSSALMTCTIAQRTPAVRPLRSRKTPEQGPRKGLHREPGGLGCRSTTHPRGGGGGCTVLRAPRPSHDLHRPHSRPSQGVRCALLSSRAPMVS